MINVPDMGARKVIPWVTQPKWDMQWRALRKGKKRERGACDSTSAEEFLGSNSEPCNQGGTPNCMGRVGDDSRESFESLVRHSSVTRDSFTRRSLKKLKLDWNSRRSRVPDAITVWRPSEVRTWSHVKKQITGIYIAFLNNLPKGGRTFSAST